ncbi:MAG: transporter [Candidatus Hatepunaea meridiana]|nr:transporter [Candidatus Hatepunaea meridiana]
MKRIIALITLVALVVVFCGSADAQILWRGAKTMKQGSFIAMGEWYYINYTKQWNTTDEKWDDLASGVSSSKWGFETMFGYAITNDWEAHLHVPIKFWKSESGGVENSESGLGDICFKTRYAVMPWAKDTHGLTLTGHIRLGTGDKNKGLGDETTDFGISAIFSTAWMGKSRGHLKANYWINGENDDNFKPGNELKVILKYDYNYSPKLMPFVTFIPYMVAEKENDGNAVTDSDKTRYTFVLGGVFKPQKGIFVRPKIAFALGGKTGNNYSFKPVLDLWYIF